MSEEIWSFGHQDWGASFESQFESSFVALNIYAFKTNTVSFYLKLLEMKSNWEKNFNLNISQIIVKF